MPASHPSRPSRTTRRLLGGLLSVALLSTTYQAAPSAVAVAAPDDVSPVTLPGGLRISTASIEDLQAGLEAGDFTSVELVRAYLARIEEISYDGPTLNAIRQVDADALEQAEAADADRAAGDVAGPLAGIPILVKDNIDVEGMPTTAGSVALANSYPSADSPLVASLREAGAIILGKTNLTEFANFTTSGMPAGYSSLGGQVLNAYDLSQTPSGSSAGSGVAGSTAMASGTVGTETSGSILSPSNANSLVGVKPTVGLISRTGVVPISATQDTAGPMTRSVYDAAAVLSGLTTGEEPEDPATQDGVSETFDDTDYTAGLSDDALDGVRLGYVASTNETYLEALAVLEDQGATLVQVNAPANATAPSILTYEFKRDLNAYLDRLPETAPVQDLQDVIEYNDAHPGVALKFGQTQLLASQEVDLDDPDQQATYEANREAGLTQSRGNIDAVLEGNDVEAIVSSAATTGVGARAGYPSVTLPAGYAAANRRPAPITFLGTAYTEEQLLSYAYDYERARAVWQPPEEINPTAFACTALGSADSDDSCDEPAEVLDSVTLASLVRSPVPAGTRPKVRVVVATGSTVPTGRVVATRSGRQIGRAVLDESGRTVLTLAKLAPGRPKVRIAYLGDATTAPSADVVTVRVRR